MFIEIRKVCGVFERLDNTNHDISSTLSHTRILEVPLVAAL